MLLASGVAWAQGAVRVSTDGAGNQMNSSGNYTAISENARYVAFNTTASNLVSGDTNGVDDVFVKDASTGAIVRASTTAAGAQANGGSIAPAISADGRYVAFQSAASNLVPGDTNGVTDIFLKDMVTGAITRVSTDAGGVQANNHSNFPAISANGQRVAYNSDASNLVPGDTNLTGDVFVKDLGSGATILASSGAGGTLANGGSDVGGLGGPYPPGISGNGNLVGFSSTATNLVTPNTNGQTDIFIKEISSGNSSGAVTLETVGTGGSAPNGASFLPRLSTDGRYLAYRSEASNLLAADTDTNSDVYFKDRQTSSLTLASTNPSGVKATYVDDVFGSSGSYDVTMSADGSHVAFASMSTDLVAGNYSHPAINVFNKDTRNGNITIDSVNGSNEIGNSWSFGPGLSADGTVIAFQSAANNLVAGDTNNVYDIFTMNECARPALALSLDNVYWATFADYRNRILTVSYRISNSGRIAYTTQITGSTASHGVFQVGALPVSVGDISTSYSKTGAVRYQVTPGVTFFSASLNVSTADACGNSYLFP